MAFTEDLSEFFDTDDFAVSATLNGSTTVNVIFDSEYRETSGLVAGTNPVAMGRASDFEGSYGQSLIVNGTTYTIRSIEPMDDGALVLVQLEVA